MSDHTKKNIEHFDKSASSWDSSPLKLALAKKCSEVFLQADGVEWNPNSTVVIDFACGTGIIVIGIELTIGLISQDLIPHASKIIGVDTSAAMVEVYNQKALINDVSQKMHGFCHDILSGSEIPEELQNVDIVVCSMSFHHFENINESSKILASLLKKGGHLLVVDLLEGNSFDSIPDHR